MARGRAYRFARFARGLNTTDGPYGLREGFEDDPSGLGAEARDLLNVVSKDRGNVSRRDGCVEIAELADPTDVFTSVSVMGQDSASFAVCGTNDGRLVAIDENTPGVETELATGLSTSAGWVFRQATVQTTYGPAYGMNGVDTPRETDGTLAATGTWTASSGSLPNGSLLEYHDNSFWVSGVSSAADAVYWSYPGNARNWPASNVVRFAPDDGSPVTAIASVGPYLAVFKERGVWVIYDSESGANRKVVDGVGTVAPLSVAPTDRGCFFLDPQQGVMLFDGSDARQVSTQILQTLGSVSYSAKAAASGAFFNGHYYLTLGGVVYDYDVDLGSWWRHDPPVRLLTTWDRGSGPVLVGAHSTSGALLEVFKAGSLTDDGTAFASYWRGPWHTFGEHDLRKRCRELHVDGRGAFNVYIARDYESGAGTLEGAVDFTPGTFGGAGTFGGPGLFGGSATIGEDSIYTLGVHRAWAAGFGSDAAAYWELDAYTMRMTGRRD